MDMHKLWLSGKAIETAESIEEAVYLFDDYFLGEKNSVTPSPTEAFNAGFTIAALPLTRKITRNLLEDIETQIGNAAGEDYVRKTLVPSLTTMYGYLQGQFSKVEFDRRNENQSASAAAIQNIRFVDRILKDVYSFLSESSNLDREEHGACIPQSILEVHAAVEQVLAGVEAVPLPRFYDFCPKRNSGPA